MRQTLKEFIDEVSRLSHKELFHRGVFYYHHSSRSRELGAPETVAEENKKFKICEEELLRRLSFLDQKEKIL